MHVINKESVDIVLMDYNAFCEVIPRTEKKKYFKSYHISERLFEQLYHAVMNSGGRTFAVDMRGIVSYPTRVFGRFAEVKSPVVLYNINENQIKDMLNEDLCDGFTWADEGFFYSPNCDKDVINGLINGDLLTAREYEINRILKSISVGDISYQLESSGLYSNFYVDIKKLFTNMEDFYYIAFTLADRIEPIVKTQGIDALVSSSINGSVISTIVGVLLGVKTVFLSGVGPRYAMEKNNEIDCFVKGKKYAYIFDFLCTGTELKIVSALINSKKAVLSYAIGLSRYKRNFDMLTDICTIETLTDSEKMGLDYKVSGEKDWG